MENTYSSTKYAKPDRKHLENLFHSSKSPWNYCCLQRRYLLEGGPSERRHDKEGRLTLWGRVSSSFPGWNNLIDYLDAPILSEILSEKHEEDRVKGPPPRGRPELKSFSLMKDLVQN